MGVLLQALLLEIPEVFETERLVLRAPCVESAAAIAEAVAESIEELRPWMAWASKTRSAADSEQHCRDMLAKWQSREELDFTFTDKAGGHMVGKGGLHTIDWAIPKFEIGYWIRSSCTRRGYATEAATGLVEFARDVLGARRVEITSDARNVASRRVAEKCGFVLEGIRRHSRRDAAGALADSCMYARVF